MIPFWFLFIQKRWNMQTSTLRREQYIYWEIFLSLNEFLIVHIIDMAAISFKTGFQAKAEILPDFLPSVISHFSGICLHVLLQLHQGTGLAGIHCTFWGFPEPYSIIISCCVNSLVDNIPYKYMSCLLSLVWSNRVWKADTLSFDWK